MNIRKSDKVIVIAGKHKGEVAAVQAAVDAGSAVIAAKGLLVNKVVIPGPRPELLTEVV